MRGKAGMTLVECLVTMSIMATLIGAIAALHLQGIRVYEDLIAADWATMQAAYAVKHLEEDIRGCSRVIEPGPARLILAQLAMDDDGATGQAVPVFPPQDGDRVMYYLSDATGDPDMAGTYLWRAIEVGGSEGFVRCRAPLARDIQLLHFRYDACPPPREAVIESVRVHVVAECSEGGVTKIRDHRATVALRNAKTQRGWNG